MYTLTRFSQGDLLQLHLTDSVTSQGVCAALCDHWLQLLKTDLGAPADRRLQRLQENFPSIIQHQRTYALLRAQLGRERAREQVGEDIGLDYEGQTMVMKCSAGLQGMRSRMAADIGIPGRGATWTLRFADGSGHVLAGLCNLIGQEPILQMQLHVFDPNIGEYIGAMSDLDDILQNLMSWFPLYHTVIGVHRTFEGG